MGEEKDQKRAGPNEGQSKQNQNPRHGVQDARDLTESDFASDKMGNNSLQGDDQANVHNERQAVPDEKAEPDDIVEGLEKQDKDTRARRDLGKKPD